MASPVSDQTTGVSLRLLIGALIGYLGLSQLLLWLFLGKLGPAGLIGGCALLGAIVLGSCGRRCDQPERRISWSTLAVCCLAAGLLLVLSGEGRLFYANQDWQVRNAVLGDMGRNDWPFAYRHDGQDWLLRAPLGMYFVPALVWQWAGEYAAGFALLAQNTLLVGTLLAAVSLILTEHKARLVALAVFLLFSGMDILGALARLPRPFDHIEFWTQAQQYSSTITLLFWVPQHAIAGWAGAVTYLLWQRGLAPARLLLTVTPLVALWSPLAMIGILPFAAHAGIALLARRQLRVGDITIPALAVLLVAPALAYLGADPEGAPFWIMPIPFFAWFRFQALEVLPLLVPLWLVACRLKTVGVTLVLVSAVLLFLPLLRIGQSADLMMRGAIPALAILALLVSEEVLRRDSEWRKLLLIVLTIGAVTGALELRRAFVYPPAPRVDCTMFEAWDLGPRLYHAPQLSKGTYLARLDKMPLWLRPVSFTTTPAYSGRQCWPGYWHSPFPR